MLFNSQTVLKFTHYLQNLDEYRRIKASSLGAEGIMDSDFNHMMETTNEQFKLLKINMKELVFPHLHKPIELLNKALTSINKNPLLQKGLFGAIIGTIGLGVVLSALGTTAILIGKIVSGYGRFLGYARDLTPVLIKNSAKLLEFVGLNSAAHNLTFKTKILQSGDKLGLASAFSVKGGFLADIRRIDKNLRESLLKTFREFPTTISKSALALKEWTVTSVKSIPSNFVAGLNGLKKGFLGIPNLIKTAIVSFRAFSVTLLTSPLGWIALAIGAVALVIYKYWKPITGFFEGIWQGLKEGLQPLMPLFKQIGNSISPILKPINFHASFCVPEDELKKLKNVAKKGEPLKFIKGNGEYVGVFVITEIVSATEQTSDEGDIIYIQADLNLREYAGKIKEKKKTQNGLKKK